MKRVLIAIVALFFFLPLSTADASAYLAADNDVVYICTGPQSKCYHKTPTCRGLNSCSKEIIKVTKKDAIEKYGRRACQICY